MEGYLGETSVSIEDTKYKGYTAQDWAMYFIESYGQIDGMNHKDWVLDQVARILKGTPILVKQSKWSNGHTEDRISTGEPSREYIEWVGKMKGDCIDGEYEYNYDVGIAP